MNDSFSHIMSAMPALLCFSTLMIANTKKLTFYYYKNPAIFIYSHLHLTLVLATYNSCDNPFLQCYFFQPATINIYFHTPKTQHYLHTEMLLLNFQYDSRACSFKAFLVDWLY